jgi:hypothetical protein
LNSAVLTHTEKDKNRKNGRCNHLFWSHIHDLYYLLCCKENQCSDADKNAMTEIKQSPKNTEEFIRDAKTFVATKYVRYIFWKTEIYKDSMEHDDTKEKFRRADEVLFKCNSEIAALEGLVPQYRPRQKRKRVDGRKAPRKQLEEAPRQPLEEAPRQPLEEAARQPLEEAPRQQLEEAPRQPCNFLLSVCL